MKPVAVLIAGVLAPTMAHGFVSVPPLGQASVDVILIGVEGRAGYDDGQDQRLEGRLLDVFEHPHQDLSTALKHPENWWLLFFEGTAPASALQAPPSALLTTHHF